MGVPKRRGVWFIILVPLNKYQRERVTTRECGVMLERGWYRDDIMGWEIGRCGSGHVSDKSDGHG